QVDRKENTEPALVHLFVDEELGKAAIHLVQLERLVIEEQDVWPLFPVPRLRTGGPTPAPCFLCGPRRGQARRSVRPPPRRGPGDARFSQACAVRLPAGRSALA